jgi:hypothetical protein
VLRHAGKARPCDDPSEQAPGPGRKKLKAES